MDTTEFLLGFWDAKESLDNFTDKDLENWEDLGFSIIMTPMYDINNEEHIKKRDKIISWCKKRNVKMIIKDPRLKMIRGSKETNIIEDKIKSFVDEFENEEVIFGAYVFDEPMGNENNTLLTVIETFRKYSERIVPYFNLLPFWENAPGCTDSVDVIGCDDYKKYVEQLAIDTKTPLLSYDHYTQMKQTGVEKNYYFCLKTYSDICKKLNIDFFNIILATAHYVYKVPTYDEFRWQYSTTLAYGAKGILIYTYNVPPNKVHNQSSYRLAPVDEYGDRTETFESIRRVNQEIHRKFKGIFSKLKLDTVSHYPYSPVKVANEFKDGDIVKKIEVNRIGYFCGMAESNAIISEFTHIEDGSKYVYIVNDNFNRANEMSIYFNNVEKIEKFSAFGELLEDKLTILDSQTKYKQFYLAPGQGELFKIYFSEEKQCININSNAGLPKGFHI